MASRADKAKARYDELFEEDPDRDIPAILFKEMKRSDFDAVFAKLKAHHRERAREHHAATRERSK